MKQILDNIELIKEKVLKFQSNDDVYMISILQRRKDHPECGANENCRMLANFYVKNIEYFDRKIPIIKEYCNHFGARAYIRPQVRSCLAINRQLLKFMADQIDNGDLAYSTLTREIIAGYHASRSKRLLLDLDDIPYAFAKEICDFIVQDFTKNNRIDEIDNIFIVPTFSGYHVISPGFNPNILQNKYILPKDTLKSDADTILYAVKEIPDEPKN